MTMRFCRRLYLIPMVLAFGLSATGETTAHGRVFNDRNKNGVLDAGEKGVAKVCVSNGREVAQTDKSGHWALAVGEDTILFVVKPAGWGVPMNSSRLPQFYYIHKPNGSPVLQVPGVAPTGPLPESIDFPLFPQKEPKKFEAVFFGDTQARGMREVNFVTQDVVEELVGATTAAFGVTLGDIVADDAGLFADISERVGQIGIPWYSVFGNHDTNRDTRDDQYSDETFERVYGPANYAFEYGQVCFIALDNIFVKPEGGYSGAFSDDQILFVRNYLATIPRDRLIVVMMHIPLPRCRNQERLLELLGDRPHTFSISAHTHDLRHLFLTDAQGRRGKEPHHHFIAGAVCGSWWCGTFDEAGIPHATMNDGAPNGYSILTFEGPHYRIRYKAARRPADYQMNIYLPHQIDREKLHETELLVNVFAGSERSKVEMRMDSNGPWAPLEQTTTIDPECLRMHQQNDYLNEEVFGWKMDYPSKTAHMWKGALPGNLSAGVHCVTVRTTDMFGQSWTAHRIVQIR